MLLPLQGGGWEGVQRRGLNVVALRVHRIRSADPLSISPLQGEKLVGATCSSPCKGEAGRGFGAEGS